jgi:hypothetical protein
MHLNFAVDLDQAQARGLTRKDVEDVEQLMKDVVVLALTVRPERRVVVRDQLVDLLLGDVALRPVDMKRARLEAQALRAVRQGTEWLTASEIADLADLGPANPIGTVSRWKQQGRIFALRQGGKDFYPKYALGPDFRPLPVVKQIMVVLAGYAPELLAAWFDSTSRFLGGKRPIDLLAIQPEWVLAAARNMVEVQEHHG